MDLSSPLSYMDLIALRHRDFGLYKQALCEILDQPPYCNDPKFLKLGLKILWRSDRNQEALEFINLLLEELPDAPEVEALHVWALFNIRSRAPRPAQKGIYYLKRNPGNYHVAKALFHIYNAVGVVDCKGKAMMYGEMAIQGFYSSPRSEEETTRFLNTPFYHQYIDIQKRFGIFGPPAPLEAVVKEPISPEI